MNNLPENMRPSGQAGPESAPPGGFISWSLPGPASRGRPACGGPAARLAPVRQSGFILIIVLVMILLVTILSVTYLRVMRLRSINANRSGGNIDLVVDSVRDQALSVIAADMPVKNSNQEDYDFPWTDASSTLMPASLAYPTLQPGLQTKGNPARDDAWLASSMPEGGNWPHLSNLMGSFLDVTTADLTKVPVNPVTQLRVPSDKLSENIETGIPFGDPRLVDATGNGIGNSLWFYPPRSQIETTRYVAAVYIEDLSGKLNLNTALPLRNAGSYGAVPPKGINPSEVDLSALSSLFGATDAQLATVTKYRSTDPASFPSGDATAAPWNAGKRALYWGNRAAKLQPTGETLAADANRYTLADEQELRFHGGINDHYTTTTSSGQKVPVTAVVESSANGLPALLRATNTATLSESTWSDAGFPDALSYLQNNPRNWLTTLNGDAARQVGLDTAFLAEELRYNLNIQNPTHLASTLGDTIGVKFFRGPDGLDNTADDYPVPAGFQRFVPLATERPTSMSYQWMCNLIDARDKDNIVTRMGDASGGWYGFEPLPLLSEVYMQRAYREASGVTTNPGSPATYTMHCTSAVEASYAFELVNPYPFPIKLTHVDLAVQLPGAPSPFAGGPYTISTDLTAAAWPDRDSDNDPVLLPGHRLILWRNSSVADPNADIKTSTVTPPHTSMLDAAVALDPANIRAIQCGMVLNTAPNTSFPPGNGVAGAGFARVDLLCYSTLKDGTSVQREDGGYSTITVPWLPQSFSEKTSDGTVAGLPTGTFLGTRQVDGRAFGLDQGLNLLQCRPARWPNLTIPDLTLDSSNTAITGAAADFGDTNVRFTRVRGGYNATAFLSANTPAQNAAVFQNLGSPYKLPLPAGRADLKNDKFWFNQQTLSGIQKIPGDQFSSLMDLIRIPAFGPRLRSAVHRGNLTTSWTPPSGSATTNLVDTTCASALYEMLGATSALGDGTGGVKPLSTLCISLDPGSSAYKSAVAANGPSHRNAPFGWLLPCVYDTLNPASDGGLNWDGSGVKWFSQGGTLGLDANTNGILDWPAEVETGNYLIPGRLNLNTTPLHILSEALPVTDASLRQQLANAIVARRNGTPAAGTRASTDHGISSTFEVLQDAAMLANFPGKPTVDVNGDGSINYKDARRYDLCESFGFLTQTTTCRSDFYAVHILVLGFDCNDFSTGPVEQRRALIIVSRAPLTTNSVAQLKYWSYTY